MHKHQSNEIIKKSKRLTFIDGLRAIACLAVFFCHGGYIFLLPRSNKIEDTALQIMHDGYLGVPIFFVISGFVIAYSVRNIKTWNVKTFINFFLRRLARLSPPYYASILIALTLLIIRIKLSKSHYFPDLFTLLTHIFYIQKFFNTMNLNVVYWTICIEIQFYLFFGILSFLCYQISRKIEIKNIDISIFLLTFLVSLNSLSHTMAISKVTLITPMPEPAIFLPYWVMFSLGIASFWVIDGKLKFRHGIFFLILFMTISVYQHNIYLICASLVCFSIIISKYSGKMTTWLNWPIIQFYGKISYSLYLVHWPIAEFTIGISKKSSLYETFMGRLISLLLTFALSTLVATVIYHVVEVPAINWSHRFKTKST